MEPRDRILQLYVVREALEAELKDLMAHLESTCKHTHVVEGKYVPSEYGRSLPPVRICIHCALEEDGWDGGYDLLRNSKVVKTFPSHERSEVYKFRKLQPLVLTPLPANL